MNYSAVIARLTPLALTWFRSRGNKRPFFSEEDCVWLIPRTSTFSTGELDEYLDALKPRLLAAEIERLDHTALESILRAHSIDDLLSLELHDDVVVAPSPDKVKSKAPVDLT